MKGYFVLIGLTMLLLLVVPPIILTPLSDEASQKPTDAWEVEMSNGERQTVDPALFTQYAVMHLLPFDAPDEAIKAVVAAQYTLACYQRKEQGTIAPVGEFPSSYTDDYWKEAWGEEAFQANALRFQKAVSERIDHPIQWKGQPIMAVMHTMNHGKTEYAKTMWGQDVPYLQSVDSAPDAVDPDRIATITFSEEEAAKCLEPLLPSLPSSDRWFLNPIHSEVGTVLSMSFGEEPLTGEALREAFSLPSSVFRASVQEGQVIFTVQGNGHFVGMSLCGCIGMAQDGATWQEIITHYYKGVAVS